MKQAYSGPMDEPDEPVKMWECVAEEFREPLWGISLLDDVINFQIVQDETEECRQRAEGETEPHKWMNGPPSRP